MGGHAPAQVNGAPVLILSRFLHKLNSRMKEGGSRNNLTTAAKCILIKEGINHGNETFLTLNYSRYAHACRLTNTTSVLENQPH